MVYNSKYSLHDFGFLLSFLALLIILFGITYFGKTSGSRKTSIQQCPSSNWRILSDVTPPIISNELFEQAQKALQRSKMLKLGRPSHQYLLTSHISCGYCGSPLVGSCLNHRYRYYHCRGYYPTTTRERICNARYIRADDLEAVIWDKVKQVLENPHIISAGINKLAQGQNTGASDVLSLDEQIIKLNQRLKSYECQEKNLIKLFRYKEIDEEHILDELNRLKVERQSDEKQLARLHEAQEQLENLTKVEMKLNEYCERVKQNLKQLTFDEQRLILDALDIKVTATPEDI